MLRNATTLDLAECRAKGFANTPHKLGGTPLHLWGDRCGGVQDPFGQSGTSRRC